VVQQYLIDLELSSLRTSTTVAPGNMYVAMHKNTAYITIEFNIKDNYSILYIYRKPLSL
jgi:hypothetical protein